MPSICCEVGNWTKHHAFEKESILVYNICLPFLWLCYELLFRGLFIFLAQHCTINSLLRITILLILAAKCLTGEVCCTAYTKQGSIFCGSGLFSGNWYDLVSFWEHTIKLSTSCWYFSNWWFMFLSILVNDIVFNGLILAGRVPSLKEGNSKESIFAFPWVQDSSIQLGMFILYSIFYELFKFHGACCLLLTSCSKLC